MKKQIVAALCGAGLCAWGFTEANLNAFAVTNEVGKLVVLGTEGSYDNSASLAKEAVFDGDTSTFFDPTSAAAVAGGCWCGLEMQTPKVCTKIRYCGRSTLGHRMDGVLIQGANNADFSDAETIHVIRTPNNWNGTTMQEARCSLPAAMRAWKFFRLLSPNPYKNNADRAVAAGNASELEFWGDDAEAAAALPKPAVPTFAFTGQINGKMNIGVNGVASDWLYEAQFRSSVSSEWLPWSAVIGKTTGTCYMTATSASPFWDSLYRVRALAPGQASEWCDIITASPTFPQTGTWIGSPGSWATNGSCVGSAAFNGNVTDYFDALYGDGNWTGLDFGGLRTITGIRFVPRILHEKRMVNGRFEVANEADFSDARIVYTIPSSPPYAVNEIVLDQPVTARYARYVSPVEGFCNIADCEFSGSRIMPAPEGLAVVRSDLTNQCPVLTWRVPENAGMSAVVVWQSTAAGGPWTQLDVGLPATATCWTNDAARIGVKNYYRLGYAAGEGDDRFVGEPGAESVAFRRGERLERTWSDNTKLRVGCTWFEYVHSFNFGSDHANRLFDGNFATFPDIVGDDGKTDNGELMAGVDFGEKCGVTCVCAAARVGAGDRAGRHCLFGTDDSSEETNAWSRTQLTTKFSGVPANALKTFEGVSDATFTKMFINSPNGNGFCNVSELEIYGWRETDVADVLQGPENLTAKPMESGMRIDWVGCIGAAGYRVERMTNDSGEWNAIASVTTCGHLDSSAVYDGTVYSYRVVAMREGAEAFSASVRLIPYLPGNGTGLTGVYSCPWQRGTYQPAEATKTQLDATINFDWWTNKLISAAAGSSNYVHVTWTGRLVVPFDGTYKFTANVDDFFTLRIDDTFVINAWKECIGITNGTVTLTKGEHPVRIEYGELTGNAYAKLYWGGCLEEEIVPSTQFIPEEPADVSPWEGNRTFDSPIEGFADVDGDTVRIGASGGDLSGTGNFYHYIWKTVSGNFDARMSVKAIDRESGMKVLLMARSSLDMWKPYVAPAFMYSYVAADSGYSYGVKRRMTDGANTLDATTPWVNGAIGNEGELRLVRKGDTFSCFVRKKGMAQWTLIEEYAFAPGVFGRDCKIGIAACCLNARTQPFAHEVTGFSVVPYSGSTMLILR